MELEFESRCWSLFDIYHNVYLIVAAQCLSASRCHYQWALPTTLTPKSQFVLCLAAMMNYLI